MLVLFHRGTSCSSLTTIFHCPGELLGLKYRAQRLIEDRQPHRILLLDRHVGKRRRDGGGVVVLGPASRRRALTVP